jgi:acylphosphatase
MLSRRYLVNGKVQGVWYRATVQRHAREAGFRGYVRNLPDGRVEAAVSCEDETCFERFEALLWKGSPLSHVTSIESEPVETVFGPDFEVR